MPNRNARLGLVLFLVYLAFYAGFVLLAAFSPETMQRTPVAGVNLAVWYGFALIAAALVFALVYGALCHPEDADAGHRPRETSSDSAASHDGAAR